MRRSARAWLVSGMIMCCMCLSVGEIQPRLELKQLMPPEAGACSAAFLVGTVTRIEWTAHALQDGDHVEVYLGHGELSGVNICYQWKKGDCRGHDFNGKEGFCSLQGAVAVSLSRGLHVVHVLLVSANGHPIGPHETVLLHMPGDDDENREELDYDEFDEAQDFDVERCGDATELNFIELARQCERHEFTEWKKRGQRHSMNYRFAERFYACAARKARNEGRTSPHAAVGLQSVYRSKELPADEEWKREQAEDAVASLTDGVTSVSERWRAARDLARTGMCVLLNNTSQRTVIGAVTLDVEEVRQTSLAEVYGRQICAMDCVDLESCDDSALYFLEFSRVDNHYRLLHAISRQLDGALIVDLGTHGGGSSFALASNGRNRVVSFDLDPVHLSNHAHSCGQTRENFTKRLPNVRYVVGDALELEPALLLQAALVVLDTAHDGVWEAKLLAYLMDGGFQGLVLLDDIHANMAMELLWAGIALPKWDVTHMGHALSGTGIVDFSGNGAAAAAPAGAQS